MIRIFNGQSYLILLALLFIISPQCIAESSVNTIDTGDDFQELTINPYEIEIYNFSLSEGDGLYGYVKVTHGEGIYFFIVDTIGHEQIGQGREVETFLSHEFAREGGRDHYWNFTTPHTSTWYVYFSKAINAPFWLTSATIQGFIREDTTPPSVELNVPVGPLTGTVQIDYSVQDSGFPILWISLLVNGTEESRIDLPICDFDRDSGYSATGSFQWDTLSLPNGTYAIHLSASDSLEQSNISIIHNRVLIHPDQGTPSNEFVDTFAAFLIQNGTAFILGCLVLLSLFVIVMIFRKQGQSPLIVSDVISEHDRIEAPSDELSELSDPLESNSSFEIIDALRHLGLVPRAMLVAAGVILLCAPFLFSYFSGFSIPESIDIIEYVAIAVGSLAAFALILAKVSGKKK